MTSRRSKRASFRLDPAVRPERVDLSVEVDPAASDVYRGEVRISLRLARSVKIIRLHARDLTIEAAQLSVRGKPVPAQAKIRPGSDILEVRLDRPAPAGRARLTISFEGRLRTDLSGFYGVRVGERRYGFTQLEATDARKFFPCFDEPAMKARFRIRVTTAAGNSVISNAPAERSETGADGRVTTYFAETPPLSTYLVALAVGELASSPPENVGPTEIRVWHVPGKERLTGFGLEAARECLARLEDWFALPYPYAKLDLVAVPDFEFGAMENAGAVFFRETLLLTDPETVTLTEQKRAAEVICHELAHMWYGDLVTMAWWDDLWLNEAFATWMAFAIVDDWKPEWKMWHDFQHGRAAALELDALRHTHPIYCTVNSAEEADENFDLITYEKGAAVVRMLERYLGPAAFRRGVRSYIRRHREGNATAADLWRALSEASKQPVAQVARRWIEREGYPLVEVRCTEGPGGAVLRLRQERFLERPPRGKARPRNAAWPIPWVGRIGTRSGGSRLERRLLTRVDERIELREKSPRFVYGNADEGGFFRPLHAPDELRAIGAALPALAAVERMGLLDHQWALVRAGRAPLDGFLDLVAAFGGEPDADVLTALRRPLAFIANSLVPDAAPAAASPFAERLISRFALPFAEAGWDPANGEADATRMRRAALLAIVGVVAASKSVIDTAVDRCDGYLADRRSLDANLADSVVALAARVGDERWHQRFVHAMENADTPQEQRRFLLALADFRAAPLIDRTLAMALDDRVPSQDVVFVMSRLLANPAARERTWRFIRRRWAPLRARMPSLLASRLIEATAALLTPEHRREVASFFRAHPVASGERALRQTLERFDWYRGFRRVAARELTTWLSA